MKERVTGLEQFMMELAYESSKTAVAVRHLSDEMKEFKDEMREFKEDIRKDTEKFKKETNKKWGKLANKMGTIVEDIVAPGLKGIGARYFGIDEFDSFAPRLRLKSADRSMSRENKVTCPLFYIFPLTKLIIDAPQMVH